MNIETNFSGLWILTSKIEHVHVQEVKKTLETAGKTTDERNALKLIKDINKRQAAD